MELFRGYVDVEQIGEAMKSYKLMRETLNKLEKTNRNNHKAYLIRCGVFQQLQMAKIDNVMKGSCGQYLTDLNKCCALMPNFYYPHWQRQILNDRSQPIGLKQCEVLHERFPDEAVILKDLIRLLCVTGQNEKAEHELNNFRLCNPEKLQETWNIEAMMHLGQPRMVECVRRCINYKPYIAGHYHELITYFENVTHENGKVLEVLNKLLDHTITPGDFARAFEMRRILFSKIMLENY